MLVTINLQGANFHAFHGAMEVERELGQVFYIDVSLSYDAPLEFLGQETDSRISYAHMHEKVKMVVMGTRYRSVEGLAYAVGKEMLTVFSKINAQCVTVRITRKQLYIPGQMDAVDVELTMDKDDI